MNDVSFRKWNLITDYIIQLIKSSMIPLSGTHCNKQKVSCVLKHFHLKLVWSIWLRKSLLCLRRKLYHLFQTHSNVLRLETNRISKSNNCLMLTISFFFFSFKEKLWKLSAPRNFPEWLIFISLFNHKKKFKMALFRNLIKMPKNLRNVGGLKQQIIKLPSGIIESPLTMAFRDFF